jgi:hypothetical protein
MNAVTKGKLLRDLTIRDRQPRPGAMLAAASYTTIIDLGVVLAVWVAVQGALAIAAPSAAR